MPSSYPFHQLAGNYLQYLLLASNGRGHGIHSPFVFDFVRNVLNVTDYSAMLEQIELLRRKLLRDKSVIPAEDYGAGAGRNIAAPTVSSVVRRAAKSRKWGRLLYSIASHYRCRSVVELGTSFGISTSYLATGVGNGTVITGEGNEFIARYAERNFLELGIHNVSVVIGNFDNTVSRILEKTGAPDLVFVDGNHRREPTLRYFELIKPVLAEASVVIFDDIHWSREMEMAWAEIKNDDAVMLTIDLFFMGMIFFRPGFKVKQHFTIRF